MKSDILGSASIREILQHPEDYIESGEYISWEQFFTDLLVKSTQEMPYMRYQKERLPDYYANQKIALKILAVMPEEIQRMLQ